MSSTDFKKIIKKDMSGSSGVFGSLLLITVLLLIIVAIFGLAKQNWIMSQGVGVKLYLH